MSADNTYKNVVLQGMMSTFVSPFVGPKWGVPKHPSKFSFTTKAFSANLNALIAHNRLTPTSAARKCKTSQQQMERWTNCKTSPTLDSVHKVARGFGIAPYQLLIPDLDPRNLATAIGADMLSRFSRARDLLKNDDAADEPDDGEGNGGDPHTPRPGSSAPDSRPASRAKKPPEKKARP